MSNELINAHIALGEPCGEEAELSVIADWAGYMIMEINKDQQVSALKDALSGLLHCISHNHETCTFWCAEQEAAIKALHYGESDE